MIQENAGLPITLDSDTGELSFHDGLLCDGSSMKKTGQMKGLFRNPEGMDEDAVVYRAYRNIRFAEDEALFSRYDYRYDITVIMPGDVNGEFYKTSGHFHGYPELKKVPYPEVYEVIEGEIIFVLQRNRDFHQPGGGKITQLQAVHVKAGQAMIVPSHCGHGSINPTDTVSAFSNIAVASCPIEYEPVKAHHGLGVYILRGSEKGKTFQLLRNENYDALPEAEIAVPQENPDLGIDFGIPCYRLFKREPERYDFLGNPEKYMDRIDGMTRTV